MNKAIRRIFTITFLLSFSAAGQFVHDWDTLTSDDLYSNELMVGYDDAAGLLEVQTMSQTLGARVVASNDKIRMAVVVPSYVVPIKYLVRQVEARPGVRYVEPNYR